MTGVETRLDLKALGSIALIYAGAATRLPEQALLRAAAGEAANQ